MQSIRSRYDRWKERRRQGRSLDAPPANQALAADPANEPAAAVVVAPPANGNARLSMPVAQAPAVEVLNVNGHQVMVFRSAQAPARKTVDPTLIPSFGFKRPEPSSSTERTSCIVCLLDFEEGDEVKLLPCLHAFHAACISEWFQQHSTCPICQQDVRAMLTQGMSLG
ncbi:RING-type domain-containing protein [Plasmodiophora brassicae]|uniref:RING-type domain-containing protein n=1 Tax=Plasmodiophora brassicae TaxID=37360 RepID=A0A0G4IKP1_PLABS|nr:hypothetical protein PBRA_004442 [Plasmodiophora brassicae]SPQ99982.1 unnamed protein product [Plasmodiophora brassicae]